MVEEGSAFGVPIVVDDASDDETGSAARSAGAIIIRLGLNGGYDKALDRGFQEAERMGMDFVITIDGDGQHDPLSIGAFLEGLSRGADMVIGFRPKKARWAERIFGILAKMRYGVRDPLCGLKAYKMELYRSLGHFDRSSSVGTELMFHGLRIGCNWEQVPITLRQRKGASRFGESLRGNLKIMRAVLRMVWW
jgi:glycosyltransferase involved in cell wall biosynthesis